MEQESEFQVYMAVEDRSEMMMEYFKYMQYK